MEKANLTKYPNKHSLEFIEEPKDTPTKSLHTEGDNKYEDDKTNNNNFDEITRKRNDNNNNNEIQEI